MSIQTGDDLNLGNLTIRIFSNDVGFNVLEKLFNFFKIS